MIIKITKLNLIEIYKNIYNSGVEPKVFLNEFLETLYYLKNINFINLNGTNFELNDKEFDKILSLSKITEKKDLLILWQFTLNNLEKIDIIKNQHQFIEMFLVRLLHLKKILKGDQNLEIKDLNINKIIPENKIQVKQDTIDQLKSIEQEEKIISTPEVKNKIDNKEINNFDELIKICETKKEFKIKYELENNVRLVSFKDNKIEISFNSNLDKMFVKELTAKLLEWTGRRWIIAFSKEVGLPTIKEKRKDLEKKLFNSVSKSDFSQKIKKIFPDAELLTAKKENE